MHLQCDLFSKISLDCSVLIPSLLQNTFNHTKFSSRPYSGGENDYIPVGQTDYGGRGGLFEVRTIHYIVVFSVDILPGQRGKTHSLTDSDKCLSDNILLLLIVHQFICLRGKQRKENCFWSFI